MPDRRPAHRRDRRAAEHRDGHDVLRRQRALRRAVDRDPLHLRADPARRGEPLLHGPHSGDPDRRDPHGHAGRGGVGGARGARPDHGVGASTSAPTASPTPTTRPTRSTCERAFPGLVSGRRPVGVVSFAQYDNVRREDDAQRGRDAHAGGRRGVRQHRHHQGRRGLHLLGLDRLPRRRALLASSRRSTRSGCGRPGRESHVEMDGAWALYEAWVLLQEGEIDAALVYCFGRSSPGDLVRDPGRAARPVLHGPAVAGPHLAGRAAGPGHDRHGDGDRGGLRRRGQPLPPLGAGQPQGPGRLRPLARGAPRGGLRGGTPAPPRAAAPHRRLRRGRRWPPATGPTSCASGRPSSPASTTGSRPTRWARAT